MPEKDPEAIVIGGRRFHGVTQALSAAQDNYLIGHLRLAGCLELLASARDGDEAAAAARTEALFTQILVSGRASHVLAGCLTEEGKPWTFAEAERNAAAWAASTDAGDKRAMRDALLGFVLGFFEFATASAATSRKSSIRS